MKERGNYWLRFLDRYLGILFLCLLFPLKQVKKWKGKKVKNVKNVLVIKIGSIGDTLLLIPILEAIKHSNNGVLLTVIGSKNNYEVLNRYSFIDSLKTFEVSNVIKKPPYLFKFIRDINTREYDVVIDFEPWPRISSILSFFIKSDYKIGFKTKGQLRHLLFDNAIPHSSMCHETDNYVSLVSTVGITVHNRMIEFPVSTYDREFVEDTLKEEGLSGKSLILFNPWSSGYRGYLKEWGINNFIRLAKHLISEGFNIGITGTMDNESQAMDMVNACGKNVVSFCGKLSIGQTAFLIKKSRILITVNTGIMHLGAALCHPMIALHGPAGVLRWGPVSSSNTYNIESDFDCAPCLNLGFEYKCRNGGCMDGISIEKVIQKINDVFKNINKEREDINWGSHTYCEPVVNISKE